MRKIPAQILLLLILLMPIAYAQDILQEKQAVLDAKASDFVSQMNAVIEFAGNRSTMTEQFTSTKSKFTSSIQTAIQATNNAEFQKNYDEAKQIAKEFRKLTENEFNSSSDELKAYINSKKANVQEKYTKAEAIVKSAMQNELERRIQQLSAYIAQQEAVGKSAGIQKLLLQDFEEKKSTLNETKLSFSKQASESDSNGKIMEILSAIKNAVVSGLEQARGKNE